MTNGIRTLTGSLWSSLFPRRRALLPVLAVLAAAPSVRAVTESYDTQTANINQLRTEKNNSPPYAGTYDSGGDLAQYANSGWFGNTPGAAAFRTFTIDGANENATARVLYPGDRFTITANVAANPSAGGYLGISFRDSTDYADFFKATQDAEAEFQLDNTGGWKLYRSGGSDDSGLGSGAERTFTITITSPSTFNATIGNVSYYDVDMAASGGTIDSLAIYTYGDANANSFWKSASLQNLGMLEFGAGNATRTISGVITDGRDADSTSIVSTNVLVKSGTGVITLTGNSSYRGGTIVSNGTLVIGSGCVPGATNITVQTNGVLRFDRSDTFGGSGADYNYIFRVNGGTISNSAGAFNTLGPVILDGGRLGSGGGNAAAWPSFYLRKSVTTLPNANPSYITSGGANGEVVISTNTVFTVADGSAAQDLVVSASVRNGNGAVGCLTKDGDGLMVLSGTNAYSGTTYVYGGTLLHHATNLSAATVVASNAILGGIGRVQNLTVDGGILSPGDEKCGSLRVGGTATWNGGSSYRWEVSDFAGTIGNPTGWDLVKGLGALTINATAGNEFTIRVASVTSAGAPASAANFSSGAGVTQIIANLQSVSGFATNAFSLDLSSFSNAYGGTWAISLQNSTNIALVYTPAPPDIGVLGINGDAIASGDVSPATADGTDFGTLDLTSSGVSKTFTITNAGSGTLNLSSLSIGGTHAADFTVTASPASSLSGNTKTTFTVRFLPGATGTRQATVTIASDDPDENPYTFAIQGTGSFNSNAFPFRVQVQFCGYGRDETLTNFPALVALGSGVTNFDYSLFLSANAGDLRFTDGDMTRLLNYEVDTWNTNGTSYVWVQVPGLAGATSSVWALWGNAAAATAPASTTNGATWSEGYAGVWHLGESSGVFRDSASTNNGTLTDANASSTRATNGLVGRGIRFVGGEADFIEIANETNFDFTTNLSLMVWARGLEGDAWAPWVSKRGEGGQGYALRRRGGGTGPVEPDWVTRGTSSEEQFGPTIDNAGWHFVAGTYGYGVKRMFVDGAVGAQNLSASGSIIDTSDSLLIGARTNGNAFWGGLIDEVRVSRVVRSTNWVWAEYLNSGSNSIFNCYGAVSGGPEMAVLGTNLAVIADGDASPAAADGTDFGTITLATGGRADRVFTITNAGNATLTLSGSPIITIGGAAAADYTLISGPTRTNFSPGQTATFTLRFQPGATGARQATISIGNNDGDENPYNFSITGAGAFDPNAYEYRLPLQFCGYNRNETLTNFPALVVLGTNIPGFSYSQFLGGSGGDLRFTDGGQTNLLNFEVESWNPSGNSFIWVQVPALADANTSIYAYWGNTNATTLPASTTNGSTWSNRFVGVWHLAETGGASLDSTTNGLTGYPSNGVTQASGGQVNGADDFGGAGSRTYIGSPAVLNLLTNDFTVSAWIRPDVLGGNRVIFGSHWGGFDAWSLRISGANLGIERLPGGLLSPNVAVTAGQWAAVAVSYDTANNAAFYINGVHVGTVAGTTPADLGSEAWSLGANSGDNFDGILDEVQVSQTTRSSNWVWAAYQNTASNSGFTCAGALQGPGALLVLGTNGALIASGSSTVSEADGTDYGLVPVSSYREHTFLLTNAGVGALTITGVTTSGVHKANFSVRSFPSSVGGLSASNLVIRFTPPGSGARTATVTVASSDEVTPSYTFTLVGSDSSAGIAIGPASLSPAGELGTNFTTTLAVTNIGSISIPYSFTSDVSWITSADAGLQFTNAALASQTHNLSISFTNPLCAAGVYTGRVVVTAPMATNSPKVVVVTATVSGPPVPTSVSATASGQELVRLAWQSAAGNPVMIVYREGAAPSADPSGCSSYAVGSAVGGGSVLYVGSGSALEHVVRTNATHYYRFYSVQGGQYYSAAVAVSAATTAYGDGLVLAESFAYTNGMAISSLNGGLGWTNAWGTGSSFLVGTGSLGGVSGYTGGLGNSISNAAGGQVLRGMPALTSASGKRYLAFQMRYLGAGYAGISFFDGGLEEFFIGQKSGAHEFGMVYYGGSSPSRGANSMTTGREYTIVAVLDLANGTASASVYTNDLESLPATEPATWQVTATGPTTSVFNRIRIGSGVGAAFDEVRIGHTWRDVVDSTPYTFDVQPTTLTFHANAGVASSSAVFQVANGNLSSYGYTNVVTYGSGASGWLNFNATNGSLSALSSVLHTARVSAIGGAGGTFVATNRITSAYGVLTQVVTVVVSGVPTPTAASVTADGPELRRLSWTESGNRDVMIVYRSGAAPAAEPSQGTSYNVGDTIAGSGATVIYIGTNGFREHVGAAGAAPYYKFYSISAGAYYSTGALVSAAAQSHPSGVIVDQAAATQGVALVSVASGQGWSGTWSVTDAAGSFSIVTNVAGGAPTFASFAGFPTSFAHRILMANQGNGGMGTAARTFAAISSGKVYVSGVLSYQYPGAQKFAGLSLMSSGSEKAFIGETSTADGYLGLDSFGTYSTVNSGVKLASYQEGLTNVFLVIGMYDFATRELKAISYRAHETVPAGEPSVWTVSTNVPAGHITSLNGVRIGAGCLDGGNSIGDVYFDEVRVARTWAALVQQTGPVLSSFSLNNGSPVTDGQMTNGSWGVTMSFFDPAGMADSPLDYDLINTNGTQLAGDLTFGTLAHSAGGTVLTASNGTQTALAGSQVYLGAYYLRWSAYNSNNVSVVNSTVASNNTTVGFTVTDDDTAGPVASGFNVSGAQYTNEDLQAGLLVTGLIQDAGSGVFGGSSNRYVLYRNGSQVDAGTFATAPSSDGAAQAGPEALAVTLAGSVVTNVGNYNLAVFSRDVDQDRDGDTAVGSNSFFFSVVFFGCPSDVAPTIAPLTDKTATSNTLLSFTVSASDYGCAAPTLSVTGLPAGATFNTAPSGTNQVGTFSWTPQTVGTFPVRFIASDGVLSSSRVIRIYVAALGESLNGQGVPVSQTNWHVTITNIQVPSSGNITLVYTSVDGVAYDVYRSDNNFGVAMSWTKVVDEAVADGAVEGADVAMTVSQRYFQVVLAGGSPSSNGVWAVIRPTVNASTFTLVSPGTAGDRAFDGALGSNLAQVLTGDNGGVGDNTGDEVLILEANQSWRNLYLSGSNTWNESNGSLSTFELAEGQGFYVLRNSGSTAQPRFTGPVGNLGTSTNVITDNSGNGGWNIITFSQGRHIPASTAFGSLAEGSPEADWDETQADLILVLNSNGSWRRIMRAGDGTWFDLTSFTTTGLYFGPGTAVFYYRQPVGTMRVRF